MILLASSHTRAGRKSQPEDLPLPPAFQQLVASMPHRKVLAPQNDITRCPRLRADMPRALDSPSACTPKHTGGLRAGSFWQITPLSRQRKRTLKQPPYSAAGQNEKQPEGTAQPYPLEKAQTLFFPNSASAMAEETLKLMAWWK